MKPTALITGANRGIGFEIARQLAGRGLHVVLGCRVEAKGEQAAARIAKEGGAVSVLKIDVSESASIEAAAKTLARTTARLDVLVNNAGIYPDKGVSVLTVSREQVITALQTNTVGLLIVTQAFLPFLKAAAPARVINVSSGYGQLSDLAPDVPSYCLSKLALNGVTIMLAKALEAERIAVNSMCPGWVRTDMGGPQAPGTPQESARGALALATLPFATTGRFWKDGGEIAW